jgi:hypothetical protein
VTSSQVQHTRSDDRFESKGVLGAFESDTLKIHCYKALNRTGKDPGNASEVSIEVGV